MDGDVADRTQRPGIDPDRERSRPAKPQGGRHRDPHREPDAPPLRRPTPTGTIAVAATGAPIDEPAPEARSAGEPATAPAPVPDDFDGFDEEDAAWIEAAIRAGGRRTVRDAPWSEADWIAAASGAIDLQGVRVETGPSPRSTPPEDQGEDALAGSDLENDPFDEDDDFDDERSDEGAGPELEPQPAVADAEPATPDLSSDIRPPEEDARPQPFQDLVPTPRTTSSSPSAPSTTISDAPSMHLHQEAVRAPRPSGRSGSGRGRIDRYRYRSRRFDPNRARVARVVAAVVVLVVLVVGTVGIGYALMRKSSTEAAAARDAATRYTPPAPTLGAAQPLMVVIGAAGLVAASASDPQAEQWPAQLADGIGARTQAIDVSSDDLTAATNADAAALAGQVPSNASLVLVVAGSPGAATPQAGVGRVLTALRTRAPQARIALVGPTAISDEATSAARRIVLAKAARAAGATWIDPIEAGWFPTPVATTSAGVSFALTTAVAKLTAAVGPLVSRSSSASTSGS